MSTKSILASYVTIISILKIWNFFLLKWYFAAYACFYSVSQSRLGLKLVHDVNENSGTRKTTAKILHLYIVICPIRTLWKCVLSEKRGNSHFALFCVPLTLSVCYNALKLRHPTVENNWDFEKRIINFRSLSNIHNSHNIRRYLIKNDISNITCKKFCKRILIIKKK